MATKDPCAACGKPAAPNQGPGFMYTLGSSGSEDVRLCTRCWNDGPNDEAWDDRIQQRIYDQAKRIERKKGRL
jgi:hypothetical protein